MKTGAQLLLDALCAHGIDVAFGYPGGAIMPLYDALLESPLRHYLVRHEQGAAFAAGGYARTSGRLGVCIATSGPGATNLVTGLTDALMDSVPVLAITGQVRSSLLGTDGFQEADVTSITAACTKYSVLVKSAHDIPTTVGQCVRAATSGRAGPVLLDVTNDALKERVEAVPTHTGHRRSTTAVRGAGLRGAGVALAVEGAALASAGAALRAAAKEAGKLLRSARRPVLIVGGGCRTANAVDLFREFAELAKVPSVATINGLGVSHPKDQRFLGMFGMHGHKAANLAVARADCMIAFGMRFDDRVTGDVTKFGRGAKIVHCDIDLAEINKIVRADVALVADLKESLGLLLADARSADFPGYNDWMSEVASLQRPLPRARNTMGELSATDLLDTFAALAPSGTVVTTDVGQHQMWAAQRLRPAHPSDFLTSAGLGAMGFGLPAAIGAQLARPNATVVAIVGDGGLQMTMHEFATIRRYRLPVKILVLDNRHLGMVRQWQELFFDRRIVATDLWDNPDFCTIASAYDIRARRVDCADQLHEALTELLHGREAQLLHCACYPADNCFPMIAPGNHIDEMLEKVG